MKIKLQGETYGKAPWRLNEDLIDDKEIENTTIEEMDQYFLRNETPEITKATIWEAHNMVIRGKLISIGARKKKEKENTMEKIVKEIYDLEQRHKKQVEVETHRTLIIKRDQLKDPMEQETRRSSTECHRRDTNGAISH